MSTRLSQNVIEMLEQAEAKALATNGPHGINVVPVSMIKINDSDIWLFDFFMKKTADNIKSDSTIALTGWSGMKGIQIKAQAEYCTSGEDFVVAQNWVKTQNPSRVVLGLIKLKTTEIFDISPGNAFSSEDLKISA